MTERDYGHLFKQLHNLQNDAPCHGDACVGYQQCEYGINGCYGEECAINIVIDEAQRRYNERLREMFKCLRGNTYESKTNC